MRTFEAASQAVEVNGETVLAIVSGLPFGPAQALRVLAAHGIRDPQPGQWFRQQAWLDAFREIAATLGPNTLYAIGRKIPDQARFPAPITSLHRALAAIDEAYRLNHRGGPIGAYRFEADGPGRALLVCDNPYPSDFDRGIITAMAERHRPAGADVRVTLDPARPTRKQGGDSCTFVVTWEA
ncbi:hypothetical protein [Mesoterricola sediminis]|uniref:Uncharacterized protein n=1 Tax=Mesoterricola sediminis TaxID=2927980 RepID=A0AA48GZR2_9BACT|nr:hypothetical protein [Mesoterricola sediminis]BDU77027.1 hypothetical protein METESE_19850 [Mesoterricola sediminis]